MSEMTFQHLPDKERILALREAEAEGPPDAIDYVIAHELCHMAEPHHGAAFHALLGRVMPDWEERKRRLEAAMA